MPSRELLEPQNVAHATGKHHAGGTNAGNAAAVETLPNTQDEAIHATRDEPSDLGPGHFR